MIDLLVGRLNNFILTGLTSLVQNISEIKYYQVRLNFFGCCFAGIAVVFRSTKRSDPK